MSPRVQAALRGRLAALALLLAVVALSLRLARPLGPEAHAPDGFSVARAAALVAEIARRPHPAGSPENARVRRVLVAALEALGLEVEVQEAPAGRFGQTALANVLARRPGRASTGAVLLAAHYDTKPDTPGAADDGAAVASILETLRVLAAGTQSRNDLVVLLSDGEERGLLGARLFRAEHAWMDDVRLVLNFEARGNAGACLMFETSGGNAALVDLYAEAVRRPAASSLMGAVYRRMPNDTDFTVLARETGIHGMNFAFIEGYTAYHMPGDTPDALSRDSLGHQGETMLAVVRRALAADLGALGAEDAVYFDVLGTWLVRHPLALARPLAALALLLAALALLPSIRRRGRALLVALLAALVGLGLSAALAHALGHAVVRLFPAAVSRPAAGTTGDPWLFAASALLALAAVTRCLGWAAARGAAVAEAGLLVWTALLAGAAVQLPEGAFIFLVPVLGAALAGLVGSRRKRAPSPLLASALLVPAVLVLAPLLPRVYAALTLTGAAGGATGVAALGLLAVPPLLGETPDGGRTPYRALVLLGLCALAVGVLSIERL